ncbi:hypothetical protein ABFX02_02G103100 [Erythranthe guttata]
MDLLENPKLSHMLRRLNTKDFKKFNTFMWNGSHVSAVVRYLQRSRSAHDSSIKLLERLEASRNTSRFPGIVLSFTENLSNFFGVPEVLDLSADCDNYRSNELLAGFLDFLLDTVEEIVKCHSDLTDPVEDQIDIMQKQLKFLVVILGDAPFTCIEIERTNKVLKQVMDVAKDAARFLHLYFFTDEAQLSRVDLSLAKLLKMFEHVEAKIREHCLAVPVLPSFTVPTADVDFIFVVSSLVNDLKGLLSQEGGPIGDVCNGIVTTLLEELMLLRSLLEVFKEQPHVELVLWIRDSAYEAEYLINSFVVGDIPAWYLTLRLPRVIQKIKLIGIGLEEIKENYNNVKYLIDSFRVGDIPVWYLKPRLSNVIDNIKLGPEEIKINASIDDGVVVGFEDEATIIADQLTGGGKQLEVISIFGMPGLGKTTLAKKLYNGPAVSYRFDRRAWVVVSEKYQKRRLLVDILKSIGDLDRDKISSMDAESLGVEIHKILKWRRYLIVMDDLWASAVWDDVRRYLPDDGNGSRILITSRLKDVAPPGISTVRALPFLSNEQCWDLLKQKLFKSDQDPPQELVDVGKKIAAHCQGLPLAVVVIAAVLANIGNRKGLWNEVAGNLSSKISRDSNMCMNILELSYKHLPAHLKPCFLYFGAFPEDSEIPVGKLTSLWIAEGFILEEDQKSVRDVAEGYLMDLIDRSLVLIAKSRSGGGGVKSCSIHDLLRELCLRKAKEGNFMNVITDRFSVYERHHRLCIPPESINVESRPFGPHIRSWLGHWPDISFIYSRMKLLRVLDLSTKNDLINLTGIEQLVHLRYLAVRVTEDHIPPSIGCLENLEFLLLYGPGNVEIAEAFLNLVNLRYLHITERATFGESCHRRVLVEKNFQMDSLQSISGLWIIHENDEKVLRCSPRLRRLKCATKPLWDSSEKCHRYILLDYLTMLESLNVSYLGSEYIKLSDTLSLPYSLKKLTLHEFKLSWNEMSMIGRLPKLEVLKLLYIVFDGKEWKTNDDEFQELKFLKLNALKIRRWNTSNDHFPKLQRLVMHKCWKLNKFPCSLGDIPTLQVIEIHSCSKSVANSASDVQREQLEMGNEELKLIISGSLW